MKLYVFLGILLLSVLSFCQTAPAGLSFQGRLTTLAGQPVPNGTAKVRVRIFDAPTGGTRLWTSGEGPGQELAVPVRNGVFSTVLSQGFNSSNQALTIGPTVFQGGVIYVEVQPLNQTPIVPRTQIWSAPWAFLAQTVSDDSIGYTKIKTDEQSLAKMTGGLLDTVLSLVGINGRLSVGLQSTQGYVGQFTNFVAPSGLLVRGQGGSNSSLASYLQLEDSSTNNSGWVGLSSGQSGGTLGSVVMGTATGEKMRVDPSGNVGIGTNNPQYKLDVNGNARVERLGVGIEPLPSYAMVVRENAFGGNTLRFGYDGKWQIGTESNAGLYLYGSPFYVRTSGGDVYVDLAGGTFNVDGPAFKPGGGTWGALSDRRLKNKITPVANPLGQLLSLHGRSFEFRSRDKHNDLEGPQIGFVAQEVEKVFPQWVTTNKDGYKGVTLPMAFNALLVESVRALKEENTMLKRKLEAEKTRSDEFERRLRSIEQRLGSTRTR
ncbi:MAG: tail fiber domain-containing protein [Chthonomonadaceae bacterium]|nr:tail fiber domain-containing protein [Chthonomonadaceae bacterium]